MSVLILHRGSLAATPYHEWLAPTGAKLLLLASAEQLDAFGEELPDGAPYVHTEAVRDYDADTTWVEDRAAELIRAHGVTDIVACAERDIERAALLRERFGLPGQQPDTAVPYRDKWEMKAAALRAGIPVAEHALVRSAAEVEAFAARHGLPVVVKPRRGAGSIGLRVLRGAAELSEWAAQAEYTAPDGEPGWLAEAYVEGAMCHIDGVVRGGELASIWPSQYRYVLADYTDRGGRVDIALDAADPMAHRLIGFGRQVLDALGGPADFAFHIEVFRTPDDDLVLCEAACRAGGAGVRDLHRHMFGVDPAQLPVLAQFGLPAEVPGRQAPEPAAGQLAFMMRPGTLHRLPDPAARPPGVFKQTYFAAEGDVLEESSHSGNFLAVFLVEGSGRAEVEERIEALKGWFLGGLDVH
ncbi:NikS protein [Streptomyces bambusae]|uniref:ATP-grasp domain-containing protein n=1 Tax=Streptomyces bambusae TaxID=1550616 RepID=UPI001CFC71F5|nr:NikS protein [Streptomyces bambusae]MCB5165689.1 NikS protein [Streptomyces bambusae]